MCIVASVTLSQASLVIQEQTWQRTRQIKALSYTVSEGFFGPRKSPIDATPLAAGAAAPDERDRGRLSVTSAGSMHQRDHE
jgi:hypothetical protein